MGKKVTSKKIFKIIVLGVLFLAIQFTLSINNKVLADVEKETSTSNTTKNTSKKQKISITKLKKKINTTVHTYTGEKRTPSVKLYNGSKKLKKDRDYTVKYKNNKKTGKATIIVKGKGNYTGTIKRYFKIAPKKAVITNVSFNPKFTRATVEWEKDLMATGYSIYMSETKDGEYSKIRTIPSKKITSYTKGKLDPNKIYYFKVRSYKLIDNKKVYSKKYSKAKSSSGLISEITLTSYSSGSNRNYNLKKASKKIKGTILRPGDTFSWFKVVGPASGANGYRKAIIYVNKKNVLDYGGGVCQVSSTLYQAAVASDLKIVERHTHSKPVSYTTSGKDATVAYGSLNLRFRNNKDYSIKIVTSADGGSTTCKMYRILD